MRSYSLKAFRLLWGCQLVGGGVEVEFHGPVRHLLCEIGEYAATRPVLLSRALRIGLAVVVLDWISRLRDQSVSHEEREPLKVGQYLARDKAPKAARGLPCKEPFKKS